MLFVHENGGAFALSEQTVGEGEAVAQLRQGARADQQASDLLAALSAAQVQAALHQNRPVSHTHSQAHAHQSVNIKKQNIECELLFFL